MSAPRRIQMLRLAIVLTVIFNLLALLVLVRATPILVTVYMFLGQPLLMMALILLVGAVLADLKAKELL
jgi:hypothetical protein